MDFATKTDNKLNYNNFSSMPSLLAIDKNRALMDEADDLENPVKRVIKKFGHL